MNEELRQSYDAFLQASRHFTIINIVSGSRSPHRSWLFPTLVCCGPILSWPFFKISTDLFVTKEAKLIHKAGAAVEEYVKLRLSVCK